MPKQKPPPKGTPPGINLDTWLARMGLRGNPFERWNAEHDRDLPNYFVDIGAFDELLRRSEPCVIFARRGCGKTAQRQMLAAQCRPLNARSSRLAVTYTYSGFEHALESAHNDVAQLRSSHHVHAILRLGVSALVNVVSHDQVVQTRLAGPTVKQRLAAYVTRFAPHLADDSDAEVVGPLDDLGSLELMEGFASLVQDAGLGSCLVLVDGLDEFSLTADNPTAAVAFLKPLLDTLPLIECLGLAFKFLLPKELEPHLRASRWFRVDRLHIFRITWREYDLRMLISQRLAHFSVRKPPYKNLAQLCEDDLAQVIDRELLDLAQGLPRIALILADMLFQTHCQQADPPELIALETWKQVKANWRDHQLDFMAEDTSWAIPTEGTKPQASPEEETSPLPVLLVDVEKGLVWLGDHDITTEVKPQDYRVLVVLNTYQDEVCTKDVLAQEAWPDAKARDGISDQTITASIARLRRVLGQRLVSEGYIRTYKGRGYRLYPCGFKEA